jgi:hypothetical protein
MTRTSLFYLLAILFSFSIASGDRVLLLVDNINIRDTHSEFIKLLESRGHKITIR